MESNANLYELFRSQFADSLDNPFLTPPDADGITYRGIDNLSATMANVLRSAGVTPGDRVVAQVPKSIEAIGLYLASLRVGAVYVPLNTAYVEDEVRFFIEDADPALFVTGGDAKTNFSAPGMTIDQLSDAASTVEPSPRVEARLADDLAAIVYTSGTTGKPKGAMLTHANLASNALALHDIWRFEPGDVLLHVLPMFHVHGLFVALHTAMLNASEVIFLHRFDADAVVDNLRVATVMMAVPTHYARLLADGRFNNDACAHMRLFTSGSAPMTKQVHSSFTERTGHTILERYGMTEAGMITSNPYAGPRIAGSVGFALPRVDVRVCSDAGMVCAPGDAGVVQVRGPGLFAGYWRLPELTEREFSADGWFITGDIGTLDRESRLTLEGRATDMIISGGLNVYPKELELVIDQLDDVAESTVIGIPHPDLGEAVVAVVVPTRSSDADSNALREALKGRVAGFKVPKMVIFADELPRNAMGKIQKSSLRETYADLFA